MNEKRTKDYTLLVSIIGVLIILAALIWFVLGRLSNKEDSKQIPPPIEETPAPIQNPTPEPTEIPTPEPTADVTPEPTENPAPEPIQTPSAELQPVPTQVPVISRELTIKGTLPDKCAWLFDVDAVENFLNATMPEEVHYEISSIESFFDSSDGSPVMYHFKNCSDACYAILTKNSDGEFEVVFEGSSNMCGSDYGSYFFTQDVAQYFDGTFYEYLRKEVGHTISCYLVTLSDNTLIFKDVYTGEFSYAPVPK